MGLSINLTVESINEKNITTATMSFQVDRIIGLVANQNTGAHAYALNVPGTSQFTYLSGSDASNRSDVYYVTQTLAQILVLINA
jgi:hypothetical protein